MSLHIIVSTPHAKPILRPLTEICDEQGVEYTVFFTGEGVGVLADNSMLTAANSASTCMVCRESWIAVMGDAVCPIELGSQTNNSALVAKAERLLGL